MRGIAERHACDRDRAARILPASGSVSCITAARPIASGASISSVGGKITDKWSVFGGLVLMQSEVTKSLVPSPQPLLFPTMSGCKLANIAHQSFSLLTKYKLTDVWEIGGQAVYRSKIYGGTFARQRTRALDPELLALRCLRREARSTRTGRRSCSSHNITNKLYYDALYQSATPFVSVAPGRSVDMVTLGEVLDDRDAWMLICVPEVLSKDDVADFRRIMDASAGRTAAPPPARNRRWSSATSSCRRTARSRASSATACCRR